ncbi:hypothetical protein THAOC_18752, partial [Thalassiosira oceanica]
AKEYKLANYIRRFTYLSMDAMTTSPVEGNNNAIKHGQFRIHSNMNLSQSLPKVYGGVNSRIERSISQAKRDTGKTSYSSRAATADFVNVKGQSLVDRNFDSRFKYKGAQTDTETWKVWCFDSKRHNTFLSEPWCYLPYYHRVHNLEVRRSGEKLFIHCSCGFYHRTGLPCPHFFFLIDEIDLMMIHVRYWKVYHAYFNEDSDIGRYLTRAQAQQFENRTCGIPIMSCHLSKLKQKTGLDTMPAYLEGTTEADWNQATYVLSQQACTFTDFDNYKNRTPTSEDECGFGDFNGGDDNESHSTYVTNEANRMHQEIEVAAKSCDKMSDDEKKWCGKIVLKTARP